MGYIKNKIKDLTGNKSLEEIEQDIKLEKKKLELTNKKKQLEKLKKKNKGKSIFDVIDDIF